MANSVTYDEAVPAGSAAASQLDSFIQDTKIGFRERFQNGGMYFPSTDDEDAGQYNHVKLRTQTSLPDASGETDRGYLYIKAINAITELFFEDSEAQEIQLTDNGLPFIQEGLIVMWSGTIAAIPTGWVLCDGTNSTPNLVAKFVRGVATAATNPGDTGGADTHTHGVGSFAGPAHTHTIATGGHSGNVGTVGTIAIGNAGHAHGISASTITSSSSGAGAVTGTSASASTLPAYFELAYIYKS